MASKGRPRLAVEKDAVFFHQIVDLCNNQYGSCEDVLILRDFVYIVLSLSGFFLDLKRFNLVSFLTLCLKAHIHPLCWRSSKSDQYRKRNTILMSKGKCSTSPVDLIIWKREVFSRNLTEFNSDQFIVTKAKRVFHRKHNSQVICYIQVLVRQLLLVCGRYAWRRLV